jgi:alkanesulfonate monooxygenase SsuD/methylene tetrahydromethanopterin reductase-like flavin-dependent oxidoreductase (luciferase family)
MDLAATGWNSAASLHAIAEASRRAHADRFAYVGDPDYVATDWDRLTSPAYAAERRAEIDPQRTTEPPQAAASPATARSPPPAGGRDEGCTTHLCVVDGDGTMVSLTQTLTLIFGSAVTVPGTGVLLNDSMNLFDPVPGRANSIAPGKRPASSMAHVVAVRDGRPVLTVGAPGGRRIMDTCLQVTLNALEFGLDPQAACAAPLIDCSGPELLIDDRLPASTLDRLRAMGHDVVPTEVAFSPRAFASPAAIAVDPRHRPPLRRRRSVRRRHRRRPLTRLSAIGYRLSAISPQPYRENHSLPLSFRGTEESHVAHLRTPRFLTSFGMTAKPSASSDTPSLRPPTSDQSPPAPMPPTPSPRLTSTPGSRPAPGASASASASSPQPPDWPTFIRLVQRMEAQGIDSYWSYDHPAANADCWTALAALAATTERIRLGTMVACVLYRPPYLLAARPPTSTASPAAASCSASASATCRTSSPRWASPSPGPGPPAGAGRRRSRSCAASGPANRSPSRGELYRASSDGGFLPPVQRPRVPILLAGGGERVTLRQVARFADASNMGAHDTIGRAFSAEDVGRKFAKLRAYCDEVDRPWDGILRSQFTMPLVLAETQPALAAKLAAMPQHTLAWCGPALFAGTPEAAVAFYQDLAAKGFQYFIANTLAGDEETIELLATAVQPSFA